MRTLTILVLVLSTSCRRDADPQPSATQKASSSASSAATSATNSSPVPSGAPPSAMASGDRTPRPVTKDETARAEDFAAALKLGREQTIAKHWADAIAAFDKALKAIPDDARAFAERGYARLLSGDLEGAAEDLDRAAERTTESDLLGQIWFNYGLVAEKRGRLEDARAAFGRSNALRPTKAAAMKVAGLAPSSTPPTGSTPSPAGSASASTSAPTTADPKSAAVCLARVERRAGAADMLRPGGSWTTVYYALAADLSTPPAEGLSQSEAQLLLAPACSFGCITVLGRYRPEKVALVVRGATAVLGYVAPLTNVSQGRCGTDLTWHVPEPGHIRLRKTLYVEQFVGDSSCAKGTTVVRDILHSKSAIEWVVDQWEGAGPIAEVTLENDVVHVGAPCNGSHPMGG